MKIQKNGQRKICLVARTEFYKDDYHLESNQNENTEFKDIDVTDIILH